MNPEWQDVKPLKKSWFAEKTTVWADTIPASEETKITEKSKKIEMTML